MFIKAYKHKERKLLNPEALDKKDDIIVTRKAKIVKMNEKGEQITKTVSKKINLSKKIEETAKLIKVSSAEEKIAEIEKIFTK